MGHELLINPSVLLLDEPTSVRYFLQSRALHLLHLLAPGGLNSGSGIIIELPILSTALVEAVCSRFYLCRAWTAPLPCTWWQPSGHWHREAERCW